MSETATKKETLPWLQKQTPDAVNVAGAQIDGRVTVNPDRSIIRADLNQDYMQIITSQPISTQLADPLVAIQALPTRR